MNSIRRTVWRSGEANLYYSIFKTHQKLVERVADFIILDVSYDDIISAIEQELGIVQDDSLGSFGRLR